MPLWHYSIMALCYYTTMPLCHYGTMALCHYGTMAECLYAPIALCHYATMPLCHYGTMALYHYATMPLGCCGRFSRGASLYRHRSQLFGRIWVRLPLPTEQLSEINSRPIMYGAVGSFILSWSWTRQPGIISSGAFGFNCIITLGKGYVRTICLS